MFLLLSTGCQFTGCLILGKKRRITEQNTSTSLKAFLHFGLLYLGHRETRADRNHPPPSLIYHIWSTDDLKSPFHTDSKFSGKRLL